MFIYKITREISYVKKLLKKMDDFHVHDVFLKNQFFEN